LVDDGVRRAALKASVAMVPYLGAIAGPFVDLVLDRHRDRLISAGEAVADTVKDLELLRRRIQEDERLADLFLAMLEVAARTSLDAKRRLAGRAVGSAVLDNAVVDESELVVTALRDLDIPHFTALERLRRRKAELPSGNRLQEDAIEFAMGEATDSHPPAVVAALVRHGTVMEKVHRPTNTFYIYSLTRFGGRLLDELAKDQRGATSP
jgi:hypothetical protein